VHDTCGRVGGAWSSRQWERDKGVPMVGKDRQEPASPHLHAHNWHVTARKAVSIGMQGYQCINQG
jgi:hypothetical protein